TGFKSASISLSRGFGLSVNGNTGAVTSTKRDSGSATFYGYANLQASTVVPIGIFSENVCTINGFPNANGINTHNGAPVTIPPPLMPLPPMDAGTPLTVKGPAGTKTIVKRVVGALFDYPGVTFGDTTPGNYFDPGHYTVT